MPAAQLVGEVPPAAREKPGAMALQPGAADTAAEDAALRPKPEVQAVAPVSALGAVMTWVALIARLLARLAFSNPGQYFLEGQIDAVVAPLAT